MALYLVSDESTQQDTALRPLTTAPVPGTPARLQVLDAHGVLATLTTGARTVTVRGQSRTFTEQKRPFADEFDRILTAGWGTSPGGGSWSNVNGTAANYSVSNRAGRIAVTATGVDRIVNLVDDLTTANITASFTFDTAPSGDAASFALMLAYQNTSNQYRARVSILSTGTVSLILEKEVAGTTTTLGPLTDVGTGWVPGTVWHIRAEQAGSTLRCRAWPDGSTEPATWLHEVTDTSLTVGRVGVRVLANNGNTAIPFNVLCERFELTSGTWPTAPTVTHDTWVRVLPEPYDGTWTPELADQIRAWAVDSTPDVLAYAMGYITGAPTVTAPALAGARIMGQALYGPLDTDGTLIEGADFHDYMGLAWTFPNGETRTAGADEAGCLDCSGFVRMIYGYHMGLPMVRQQNIDGVNLPRITRDIGPNGPGVIVAQAADAAPPLSDMQIGDVPHFDATTDAVAGQLDHNGIYLGPDTSGHPRFINSRKTPHGPTFGDLGGPSTLDGTGLYAATLRIIRRF
ncbi:hypothetical protein [Streptomyces sp. NPDC017520]|uniref:hypothetical protein n=1 Tax=Streptomyces sp. NPDC017520 TaxID=3364998 RepID=UPI0037AFC057